MARVVHLTTPITVEQVRSLQIDDEVYVTGEAYCMLYADHYTLIMDKLKAGEDIPMDLQGGIIYNTGAIWRRQPDGERRLYAVCATSSNKFNALTPEFIRLSGIRAVIGKGGMDSGVLAAMQEYGCVYLSIAGGCCAIYTPNAAIVDDYEPQIPPTDNQRLKFELKDFGPLFVAMDAHGNSAFQDSADFAEKNIPAMYDRLNIKRDS